MSRQPTSYSRTTQSRPTTARPMTGQSRPTTGRPRTAASTLHDSNYIVAVLEGRGVGRDVGIAALDKDTGRVVLLQLADCQTYVKTLHQIHVYYPSIILVPDTFLSLADSSLTTASHKQTPSTSLLVQYMREEFSMTPVEPVPRKFWNDTAGLDFLNQLCVEDDERTGILLAASKQYYALSAVCALFKHVDAKLNTRFAARSLRVRCIPVEGTMMIDTETARNLELGSSMSDNRRSPYSLFGTLKHTHTAMASRLLRVNIFSPITEWIGVESAIESRLDVVEELVKSEERYKDIKQALKSLNKMDFDKLIASLASSESRPMNNAKPASARVSQMLNLRNILRNMPSLRKALEGSRAQLLQITHEMLSDDRLDNMDKVIFQCLNEEGAPSKGGIGAVNARVWAVKANQTRLLDVARATYKENVGDIYQLNRDLSEKHELPLVLIYQGSGFVFALKKNDVDNPLPKEFINVTTQKNKYLFSSLELKKMNARMKDALDEALILSDKIIQDLVAEILVDVGALYKASEAVALVDMLWSFAHASILHNYVRPEFTDTLAIKGGRHPVLECVRGAGTVVPNDVYCCDTSSFQILQGPNMSGKSTYIKQIGLTTVMAMCGCFVPAEYASFRIYDAMLTRLSNDDDIEKSLSTFANEMASSAMILGLATSASLVLIDELGRGTSPKEGLGISHAIAERLIEIKASVFFATHFSELAVSLSRRPSVVNLHLSVQTTSRGGPNLGIAFRYKVVDGPPDEMEHYGLELARLADLPPDVIQEATRVSTALAKEEERLKEQSVSSKVALRRKALLQLRSQLTKALDHSTLPDEDLKAYVKRFQTEIATVLHDTM